MDARGWETCRYMWELSMPFRLAHRINIELNGLMEESQREAILVTFLEHGFGLSRKKELP